MRKPILIAAAASLVLWVVPPDRSNAFGTINSAGQKQEHAEITRLALADADFGTETLWILGGGRRPGAVGGPEKYGAVGAADRLDRGLVFESAPHCDNGDALGQGYPQAQAKAQATLETCKDWILDNMDLAVEAAGLIVDAQGSIVAAEAPSPDRCRFRGRVSDPARCRVLEHLGLALHASQDFYSHSNWTDVTSSGDPVPGLGKDKAIPWLQSRSADFEPGVITGCFQFLPESWFCHGRIRHDDLSKDKGDVGAAADGRTVRGANGNFGRAVAAAVEDSKGRWTWFETAVRARHGEALGNRIICVVRSDNPATCASA